jgi:hypothetical protein
MWNELIPMEKSETIQSDNDVWNRVGCLQHPVDERFYCNNYSEPLTLLKNIESDVATEFANLCFDNLWCAQKRSTIFTLLNK